MGYVNKPLNKKALAKIVGEVHAKLGMTACMDFLDRLKELGFHHATEGGISIGIDDIIIPPEKERDHRRGPEGRRRLRRAITATASSPTASATTR